MEVERPMEEESINHDIENVVDLVSEVGSLNDSSKIVELAIGMEFDLIEALKTFYKKYSTAIDFGWKIRNSKKGPNREMNYLIFACIRERKSLSKLPTTLKILPTVAAKFKAEITIKKGM